MLPVVHWITRSGRSVLIGGSFAGAMGPIIVAIFGCARAPDHIQSLMSNPAMTLVGRTRTTTSPGTALRRPNSSARSAPMYRAPVRVAMSSTSCGSSLSLRHALHLHEGVRRVGIVRADHDPWITLQCKAFRTCGVRW